MKHNVIGMDVAKHIFQLHTVDPDTGEVERVKLRRQEVLPFFAQRQPALVAMEACGGAHWWGRKLNEMGHRVQLLPAKAVRPFVLRNKTDAADARAIWTAAQQPEIKTVAIKSEFQQCILALHRLRAQLLKFRSMQSNALRGLLLEFGRPLPEGFQAFCRELPGTLASIEGCLPSLLVDTLREQWERIQRIDGEILAIESRLKEALRETPACRAIAEIPGVGLLTATAAVATMGDPRTFRTGREFAAWLGLVPRQTGTGGKVRQLGISKRGDVYLRTLLMHGARAMLAKGTQSAWIEGLLSRRPYSVAVAAIANKLARTIWAVLARGLPYQPGAFRAAI